MVKMQRTAGVVAVLGVLVGAPTAAFALSQSASPGTPDVTVSGTRVTVSGTVKLVPNSAAERRQTRVRVRLDGIDHAYEVRTVALSATDAYTVSWTTRLRGSLTLVVSTVVHGRAVGSVSRTGISVAVPARTVTVTTTVPAASTPTAASGTLMLGTFELAAGSAPSGATPSGTYVEMLTHSGGALPNASSPAANKNYTTFGPGTQGGLSTVAYQPAPSPAFSKGTSGNALANAIVQPVAFEGYDFSIDTQAKDVQTGQSDPLPQIYDDDGTLSGQISAWDAQWNGQSFNQGSPKPDGTLPAPTTAVSGTYDASTGAFTLTWRSAIVGGPFNGYSGLWHLQGTFVPASA